MGALRSLVRAARWHRRLLAALLAGLAALLALTGLSRGATVETTEVVTAARLVPAGSVLTTDDLEVTRLPASAVPDGAARAVEPLLGQLVGAGLRRGQVLTDLAVVVSSQTDGRLVVGVRVTDPDLARLAPPGTRVTLFAAGAAEPVVSHVVVRGSPARAEGLGASRGGLLLVEVDAAQAAAIARLSASTALTVAIG